MSMTPGQQEVLLQFHAITNSADIETDRALLERVGWDVQVSISLPWYL